MDVATLYGWEHLHVRKTRGRNNKWVTATNIIGWPDLLLMRPDLGFVAAEIKVPPDKPSDEQLAVLRYLEQFPSVRSFIWEPDDWPMIETTLMIPRPSSSVARSIADSGSFPTGSTTSRRRARS